MQKGITQSSVRNRYPLNNFGKHYYPPTASPLLVAIINGTAVRYNSVYKAITPMEYHYASDSLFPHIEGVTDNDLHRFAAERASQHHRETLLRIMLYASL